MNSRSTLAPESTPCEEPGVTKHQRHDKQHGEPLVTQGGGQPMESAEHSKAATKTDQDTPAEVQQIHPGKHTHAPAIMSEREKQLTALLEEQKKVSLKLQQELAELKIQTKIDIEQEKQEQWACTIANIKEANEVAKEQYRVQIDNIHKYIKESMSSKPEVPDIAQQLKALLDTNNEQERIKREEEEAEKRKNKEMVANLLEQQKQLMAQAEALQKSNLDEESKALLGAITSTNTGSPTEQGTTNNSTQQQLIEQLKQVLGVKEAEDPQKAVLKHFLSKTNTTTTTGGATTLKPQLLKQLTGERKTSTWQAGCQDSTDTNKVSQNPILKTMGGVDSRSSKSGILDKATSNIQQKEVWPQKNLLEDWADEEISFNQMLFEHHVQGKPELLNYVQSQPRF